MGTERYPPSMFEKRQHSKDTWLQSDVATFVLNQILEYLEALYRRGDRVFFVEWKKVRKSKRYRVRGINNNTRRGFLT